MIKRFLAAGFLLGSSSVSMAGDGPSQGMTVHGYTGLLSVPTATVIPEGYLELQYNEAVYEDTSYDEHSNFHFAVGIAPRLELGGSMQYARKGTRDVYNDLSAHAKLLLVDQYALGGLTWSLAAGWVDPSGDTEVAQRFEARYVAGTARFGPLSWTLGYGAGPDRLDGAFGGLSYSPIKQLTLLADHDGEFTNLGARIGFDAGAVARLYAIGRNVLDKQSAEGYGLGARVNLRFDRREPWFEPHRGTYGLRRVRRGMTGEWAVVRAENAAFLQRQQDSASAACAARTDGKLIEYWQYRYGIPVVRSLLDCKTGRYTATAWLPQFGVEQPDWEEGEGFPLGLEIRLGVEQRSFVGVNTGRHEYSTAFQSSARLQGPFGLGGYITHNSRLEETDGFEEPTGLFHFQRLPQGVREYAGQVAFHPFNGLIGVATGGRTYVDSIEYDFQHVEVAYLWGHGAGRTRITHGEYQPAGALQYAERETNIISHRYWIEPVNTSVEIGGGDFFYDDSGSFAEITRYFGDVTVTLFARVKSQDERVAGIGFGIPLTTKIGLQLGPVSVVGMPRFDYRRGSSFNNTGGVGNILRPNLLVEPRPIYNLMTDWLDSDRLYPAYSAYSEE